MRKPALETYVFTEDKASLQDVFDHLYACSHRFVPSLDSRVDILQYSTKICENATTYECWNDSELVGLVAVYVSEDVMFVTSVSVLHEHARRGIASELVKCCIQSARRLNLLKIRLEVNKSNTRACELYLAHGFKHAGQVDTTGPDNLILELKFEGLES